MSGFKVIIVDDETDAIDLIETLLRETNNIYKIFKSNTVDDAFKIIKKEQPDIVFLDIELQGESGFDLVVRLKESNILTYIVFITAYNSYAVDAIKNSVFDYLLKPIDKEDLISVISRIISFEDKKNFNRNIEKLLSVYKQDSKIKFNTRTGFIIINSSEIVFFEAEGNYTTVYINPQRREIISMNIGKIENRIRELNLNNIFIRLNRSYILNKRYLSGIDSKVRLCFINYNGSEVKIKLSKKACKMLKLQEII